MVISVPAERYWPKEEGWERLSLWTTRGESFKGEEARRSDRSLSMAISHHQD